MLEENSDIQNALFAHLKKFMRLMSGIFTK